MSRNVVIVGNGIAGITAARFVRKAGDDAITVVSAESEHFYSRTALMYLYMGHMRYADVKPYEDAFWPKNRIALVRDHVERVDLGAKRLRLRRGADVPYDVLLLATGSRWSTVGWPGEELEGVQGLYGLQDLEAMERNTRGVEHAVVVGGGLIGVEMAEMLHSRGIHVTFLVREPHYMAHVLPPEEGALVGRAVRRHGIDLRLNTELEAILPDRNGRVGAVVTRGGERIPCGFVGLTVGVRPNSKLAADSGIETGRGILVNEYLETSAPGVYAAGDCVEFRDASVGHQAIEQLWYTGRNQGRTVARTLCGERTAYRKGVFFNSAKFFDLEYQTYGRVAAAPEAGTERLLWQDAAGGRLVRIDHDRETGAVTGFNLLGIRYRQEVCERWIREQRPIGHVVANLEAAAFDPEFARPHARALRAAAGFDGPPASTNGRPSWTARLFGA